MRIRRYQDRHDRGCIVTTTPSSRRSNGRNLVVGVLIVAAGAFGYFVRGQQPQNGVVAQGNLSTQPGTADTQGRTTQGSSRQGARGGQGRGGAGAAIPVQAVESRSGTLVAQRNAAGTVVPVNVSQVAAQTSGVTARILARVGDTVQANQAIVQLDDTQLRLAAQNAQFALQNAQINLKSQSTDTSQATVKLNEQVQVAQSALDTATRSYKSTQQVYAVGGASSAELENARGALAQARANLSSAQSALSQNQRAGGESLQQLRLAVSQAQNQLAQAQFSLANATLKAPFAGQIVAINAVLGQIVSSNTAAFSLASTDQQLKFSVPPSDAASLAPGQILSFDTGGQRFQVKVDQRPAAPVTQNVPLTAHMIGKLTPGSGVVGTLTYSVNLAKGTIVPISTLQSDGTRTFVFVMQGDKAKSVTVSVLAQAGSDSAVTGLEAGLEVILSPPPGLLEGASVTTTAPQTGSGQGSQGGGSNSGQSPNAQGTSTSGNSARNPSGRPANGQANQGGSSTSRQGAQTGQQGGQP